VVSAQDQNRSQDRGEERTGPTLHSAVPSPSRIPARDIPAVVDEIRAAADANPDAEFEITWRIVTR
ncbi:MAG: hypothetical protein ACRDNW_14520, partial [Trebonia sp.]